MRPHQRHHDRRLATRRRILPLRRKELYAIVEYEDGSIGRIAPELIKFSDNLFERYKEDAEQ